MRSRKKELEPIATAFAGTDEELARRLQEEEMLAATPRTRTRTRNPDALVATMSKSLSTSFSFKHDDPAQQMSIDTPARREQSKAERAQQAEPADSPSSRQDTLTALGAVMSTSATTARKRPAPETSNKGRGRTKGKQRETTADTGVGEDEEGVEQHSRQRDGPGSDQPEKSDEEEEDAHEEEQREGEEEEETHAAAEEEAREEKPVRKRRRRRDPVVPDTPPSNGVSSGADSGEAQPGRRQLRHSDRHAERERKEGSPTDAPPLKRPRRPRTSNGRKLPKLPMVRHGTAWYRARTVQDDGVNIMLELTGFQGSDATLLLPLDSDRLWRGSYKGKDWRYLGDGAWAPKVPQHKPLKHHRRGRGGPRTSSGTQQGANGHGSGLESDAPSDDSSSDDDRVSDKVLRDSNAMNGDMLPSDPMGPHPAYACMGDQNWQGDDGKVEGSGRAHSAPSPRRRKSIHKPARAPMDADFPAKANGGVPCGMVLDLATHASMVGMFPVIPGTPPMDCCYHLMSPASMGLKPLSPDEVPPPPPPEEGGEEGGGLGADDATELELVAAEAMMTCKVEMTRHAWRDAQSQGPRVDDKEDEEAAAAVALLGQSAFQQNQLEEVYAEAEPDLVMVSPNKRGGGRGRGGGAAHRRNGTAGPLGGRRRGPKVTTAARNSLGTFRALLGALGDLERPARQAALALARTQLHRVLAVPSEVLNASELVAPVPPIPLFC